MEYVPVRKGHEHKTTPGDVLARVRAIPPGFVRAYGDIVPGAPRFAGAVLHDADEPDLPWWRVVRADGSREEWTADNRHIVTRADGSQTVTRLFGGGSGGNV